MNVVKVGDGYAALNGGASGYSDRYAVEEKSGRQARFERASNNDVLRSAGIVSTSASDPAIGSWWTELNWKLERQSADSARQTTQCGNSTAER